MAVSHGWSMSRREFSVMALALLGSSSFFLSGCGGLFGSSGGSQFALAGVTGQLTLPTGIDPSTVQVVGGGGFGAVTGTTFSVQVQSQIPSLVLVLDTNGTLVLFGIIDPASSTHAINAESTATAIMFLGLGGMELNPTDRRNLLARIAASSELAILTGVLNTELSLDPLALNHAPQNLRDAIEAATTGFNSPGSANRSSEPGQPYSGGMPPIAPMLQRGPSEQVDGLTFVQSTSPLGFQVQNVKRRFGRVRTYITSHVDQDNVETQQTPPSVVGAPLDIPLTVGLLNTSGTGWSQVTSAPFPLRIVGQDKKTKYEMIALTPVFGGSTPAIYSDSRYAGEVNGWKDECGNLRQSVMLAGFMEIVLEILGLGGATMSYTAVQGAIAGLLTTTQVIRTAMTSAYLGNVFYGQVIGEMASSMTFEEIFLAELPLLENLTIAIKGDIAANTVRNAFVRPRLLAARAALVALVALGIIELADILAIAKDTTSGSEANVWTGLVFQPVVGLSASRSTYVPGGQVIFTAEVPPTTATLLYHWKGSGSNLMVLDDGTTFDQLEFDSPSKTVTLSTTPSTVGDLTVRCEVFDVSNGGRVSLGAASKTLGPGTENQVFSINRVRVDGTAWTGMMVAYQYIVIDLAVDETGANGLKIIAPDGSIRTWKGSSFVGVTGTTDVYHFHVDINGDLVGDSWVHYAPADQVHEVGAFLTRVAPGRAGDFRWGPPSPYAWRATGNTQQEFDASLAAMNAIIDPIMEELQTGLQVQYLPGY